MKKQNLIICFIVISTIKVQAQCPTIIIDGTSFGGPNYSFKVNVSPAPLLPSTYIWEFGDGTMNDTVIAYSDISHSFADSGTYNVCVHYISIDCDTIVCQTGYIPGKCSFTPEIYFNEFSPGNFNFGSNTQFYYGYRYYWDFGDGSPIDTTYPYSGFMQHTYAAIGVYYVCLTVNEIMSNCSKLICDSLTVNNLVGINEQKGDNKTFYIHPNPTTGKIIIYSKSNINSTEIYNMLGEKIYSASNFRHQSSNEIDLSDFPKGIYFVNIFDEEKIYTKRIVIQ